MPDTHSPLPLRIVHSLLIVFISGLVASCPQVTTLTAAEIVCVEILDGDQDLMGIATTNLGQSHAALWDLLKTEPLITNRDFVVPVSTQDPLKAMLRGKLTVRLIYRGSEVAAQAKVDTLTLVRKNRQSDEWYLSAGDIERTRRLAGITEPAATPSLLDPSRTVRRLTSAVAVLAVATLIAFIVRMRLARQRPVT